MSGSIRLIAAALLAIGSAACGEDGQEASTTPANAELTSPPAASNTTDPQMSDGSNMAEPSTAELTEGAAGEIFDVTFDGSECTVADTIEGPPGDYAFVMTDVRVDRDEVAATLFARTLLDDHTFQDALDAQAEAGGPGSYWPRPAWAGNAESDWDAPVIELADNQQMAALALEPGDHLVGVYTNTSPTGIWLCASVVVAET